MIARIFWVIYVGFLLLQKVILPLFFWLLSITTAPEDTGELMKEGGEVLESLNGNIALDLTLLAIGTAGLIYSFGSGNWRLTLHRYLSRPKLIRLRDEARRVAEDIAATLSQERTKDDHERDREWRSGERGGISIQDNRYLAKHMMEAHSAIKRLEETGYWQSPQHFHEIGTAGATRFAAEETAKSLYAASERIRCDLEDGFITLLTKPPQR